MINECEFGCGKEGNFYSHVTNMWRCAKSVNACKGMVEIKKIYKGKKIMIVNTASACGYTPQYDDLQQLFEKHKDKLIILGFPSNNFGGQEPASNNEILAFCIKNYGVTFPLFEKSDVTGTNQNTLYKWLTDKQQNGWNTQSPDWNFCKYLINEEGELMKFYSSSVNPLSDEVLKIVSD